MRELAGPDLVLMGGISNRKLLRGTPEEIAADAKAACTAGTDIVGPECAIPLITPLANVLAITEARDGTRRQRQPAGTMTRL